MSTDQQMAHYLELHRPMVNTCQLCNVHSVSLLGYRRPAGSNIVIVEIGSVVQVTVKMLDYT
jgi:hypothetical protein